MSLRETVCLFEKNVIFLNLLKLNVSCKMHTISKTFEKIDSDGVHSLISFTSILDKRVHYDPQRWQKLRWVEGVSLWHLFSITIFPKRSLMEAPFIQRIVARLFFYSCTLKISALSFQLLETKWEPSCEIYVFVFLSTWGGERPSAIESIFWRTDLCTYVYKGLSSGLGRHATI